MSPHPDEPDDPDGYRSVTELLERPPVPTNWNLLDAEQAEIEWHDLDQWVKLRPNSVSSGRLGV